MPERGSRYFFSAGTPGRSSSLSRCSGRSCSAKLPRSFTSACTTNSRRKAAASRACITGVRTARRPRRRQARLCQQLLHPPRVPLPALLRPARQARRLWRKRSAPARIWSESPGEQPPARVGRPGKPLFALSAGSCTRSRRATCVVGETERARVRKLARPEAAAAPALASSRVGGAAHPGPPT